MPESRLHEAKAEAGFGFLPMSVHDNIASNLNHEQVSWKLFTFNMPHALVPSDQKSKYVTSLRIQNHID